MRKRTRNIIVTGGKTGGHIYPALAIADILQQAYGVRAHYIGAKDGMERKIMESETIPFYGIGVAPLVGIPPLKKFLGMFRNLGGFFRSLILISKIRPELIIGTGGFVAGPVLAAAFLLRVPIVIHEQNVAPGFTNILLSRVAREIWMTFNESASFFPKGRKLVLTGMPLRKNFQTYTKEEGRSRFGFGKEDKILLVTGGSQGSSLINRTIRPLYRDIIERLGYKIIHVTGPSFYQDIAGSLSPEEKQLAEEGRLLIREYIREMDLALNAADVTISRSGASFICELIATNSFSIQIPMKRSAANHQLKNAKAVEKAGLGTIIEEDDLTSRKLFETLETLQPEQIHNIIRNNVGILYGENTREIIRKESGKYLHE